MISDDDRWDSWLNAQLYAEYDDRFPLYRKLNRRLMAAAEVAAARRVLDVACGTGATTRCCLERLPRDAEIVAIDRSRAMVELARARIDDPRVRFVTAQAEELTDRLDVADLGGRFDRVLCNAALVMFERPERVFVELADLTEPGALVVFNLPAPRVDEEEARPHPFQLHFGRALSARGGPAVAAAPEIDLDRWLTTLRSLGFEIAAVDRYTLEARQGELMELMGLPAMLDRAAAELPPRQQREAWEQARGASDPELPVGVDWLYVTVRRREDAAAV